MNDKQSFQQHLEIVSDDCEKLIQKHLEAGMHPLAICGALTANMSELFREGSLGKEEFIAMVESAWSVFGERDCNSKVVH
tara:strand:+ start:933 stop:1172 length:240 start_codon:yes stop_codon:yes gene_type:complete